MTSDDPSQPEQTAIDPDKNGPGVLCGRCNHLNCAGQDKCELCGWALFIQCPHCGAPAAGVYVRCQRCRHRLPRRGGQARRRRDDGSPVDRANRQLLGVLAIVLVLLAIGVVLVLRLRG